MDAGHRLLGESSLATYWSEGHVSALDQAVNSFRATLSETQDGSEEKLKAQIGLTDALRLQVEEGIGGDDERWESLALAESGLAAATRHPALYPEALRALAEVLADRPREKTTERLQHTIDTFRQLVDLTTNSQPDVAVRYIALYAQALNAQWYHTGDKTFMEQANSAVDRAMRIRGADTSPIDPDLGFAFMVARASRCDITDDIEDVTQAINMGERFIAECPPGHPLLVKYWISLGNRYAERSSLLGDDEGFDERRLHAYSEARRRLRPDHSLWHMCNGNYASDLYARYQSRSTLEDLNEAIAIARSVVARVAEGGYKQLWSHGYVLNLSVYLTASYAEYGNLEVLDEAIALQLDSIDYAPPSLRQSVLRDLGRAYHMRYTAHGRPTDLENAISFQEQATLCPDGPHTNIPESKVELGEYLLTSFDANGQQNSLEHALSVLRATYDNAPDWIKGLLCSMLGHALLKKAAISKNTRDIKESIRFQNEALAAFPEAHYKRSLSYRRLGLAEYSACVLEPHVETIENSIIAYRHALTIMPPDHPDRAACLSELATSQLAEAKFLGLHDLTGVLGTLQEAALHAQSWPATRYAAAALWARTAHRVGLLYTALDAYRVSISLLPEVAWIGLEDELRLQRLSQQPPDISQDAAACAIELGLYELAVEIIDGSRSILWNTSQELRVELGRLREEAPDFARELARTNAALAFRPSAAPKDENWRNGESERRRIHRLALRRTELLHSIRSIPGFERFLLPPSYDDLRHASRDGPIAILISSTYRCDAVVLRPDANITLVPLGITQGHVIGQVQTLQKLLRSTRDQRGLQFIDRILLTILQDLWDQIGKPVWLTLGQRVPAGQPPRLWWCPTGIMTSLPVHACGPYSGVDANMTDLIISSYTPTLSALLRSQTTASTPDSVSPPQVLVVSQPEVLNRPTLPCALAEARILYSLLPSRCTFLVGPEGTVERVQDMLRHHNWLHISSHGTQNCRKPLDSSIALHDGELRLSDLAQSRLPNADFAFLSACHSAKGAFSLPDEAMHLAAGMMFAGFRSVVATSWAIADRDAPVIAEVFYGHLTRGGKTPVAADTAEALHVAIKELRESGAPLYRWVPFVHLGA